MYVHRRRLYATSQLLLDIASFWPIWALTARLRIALDPITTKQLRLDQAHGWVTPFGAILLLFLVLSANFKLYAVPREIKPWSVLMWAFDNSLTVCGVSVFSVFFSREFGASVSRAFVLCLAPVTFLIFLSTRVIALSMISAVQRRSQLLRIAIIGDTVNANLLIARLKAQAGTAICGVILPRGASSAREDQHLPILGTTDQVAELVNIQKLDRVIVINDSMPESELARCNSVFWRMGLPVSCTLSLASERAMSGRSSERLELSRVNGLHVVDVETIQSNSAQEAIKRAFDLSVSLLWLILLSPLMLAIAVITKVTLKGPVFEKAPRVGKGGRHFTCLKFRTTYEDLNLPAPSKGWNCSAESGELHHPTPFGLFLRRYSLDELPQLANIIRGDMSIVGPRPLPAHHLGPDGMSQEFFEWSEVRAQVRPGLTGLWQVGGRSNLTFDNMIRLDLEYVRNRSFSLDLSICLETPLAVLSGVGAS